VANLEHISSILSRALKDLEESWEEQEEREEIEGKDEKHNTTANQIQPILEPSLDSDQSH
jgi:hypothetical protein